MTGRAGEGGLCRLRRKFPPSADRKPRLGLSLSDQGVLCSLAAALLWPRYRNFAMGKEF